MHGIHKRWISAQTYTHKSLLQLLEMCTIYIYRERNTKTENWDKGITSMLHSTDCWTCPITNQFMFVNLKWTNLRCGNAATVWKNRLTLLEAAIGNTVGRLWDCRGRRWRARVENMGSNGFGYIIKYHSFN